MEYLKENSFSHLTAKERKTMSFPSKFLLNNDLLEGKILDFGCGLGKDVEALQEKGFDIIGYDPHYFPNLPKGKFDTILCHYVLNVLFQEVQSDVLMQISQLLKPSGKAYFTVRRDLTNIGFRKHAIHKKETYQCNVILPFESLFLSKSCEIYIYQPITQLNTPVIKAFLEEPNSLEMIFESGMTFAVFSNSPISIGHTLLIPKRIVPCYSALCHKEQKALALLNNKVKTILDSNYSPKGYSYKLIEYSSQYPFHIELIPIY